MAHRIKKAPRSQAEQPASQPQNQMYYEQQPQKKQPPLLPRPVLPSTDAIYRHDKQSFRKGLLAFPTPESLFISENNYDAGPQFLRPSSAMILATPRKINFPYGAWVNPLASEDVFTVRVRSPFRCNRCKAYLNPYFRLDGGKTSATCNICGVNSPTQGADPANFNTPEVLTEGVIDFVVQDKIYIKKRLDLIKVIVAIEMGHFMSESDVFNTIIQSVKAAIENTSFEKCIRIGVVYFSAEGTTYLKLNRKDENWREKRPRRYTVKNGTTNLCCPLSDSQMLFDPNHEKEELSFVLDYVQAIGEDFYKNSKYASHGASYPATIKSLLQNFEKETGRIMLFAHTTPKIGPLAIRVHTEEDSKCPLKPLGDQFIELAKELKTSRVGVDTYLFSKDGLAPQEVPTMHYISSATGGSLKLYSPYNPEKHSESLYYNIYGSLSRKYVYDVGFTARVSNGLNISCFGVGDGIHETRDVALGMMDPANSVSVHFEHEQKIPESGSAFLQYAMMFTTGDGERRVRILNYRYMATNKIEALHEAADYLTVANLILRLATPKLLKGDPTKIREDVINKIAGLALERAQENTSRISSSFMAHPNLAPAFAYIHSFINSKVTLNSIKASSDYRMSEVLKANTFNFLRFSNYFYPKIFSLGMEIYEEQLAPGEPIEGDGSIEQSAILPPSLPLTLESVKKDGVYLKWGEDFLQIFVQPEAPEDLLIELFGTCDWKEIEDGGLPELETSHNIRVNIIIDEIRRRHSRANGIYLPLLVSTAMRKGPYQEMVNWALKEDYPECRYFSFLDSIHRLAQTRMK